MIFPRLGNNLCLSDITHFRLTRQENDKELQISAQTSHIWCTVHSVAFVRLGADSSVTEGVLLIIWYKSARPSRDQTSISTDFPNNHLTLRNVLPARKRMKTEKKCLNKMQPRKPYQAAVAPAAH